MEPSGAEDGSRVHGGNSLRPRIGSRVVAVVSRLEEIRVCRRGRSRATSIEGHATKNRESWTGELFVRHEIRRPSRRWTGPPNAGSTNTEPFLTTESKMRAQ